MADADPDRTAPIASQVPPGPDRQEKKRRLDDAAEGDEIRQPLRQKPAVQSPDWNEEKEERRSDHDLVKPGRRARLRTLGGRRVPSRDTPVHEEGDPEQQ